MISILLTILVLNTANAQDMSIKTKEEIVCSISGKQFVSASENSIRAIQDLLDSSMEIKKNYEEFMVKVIELDKRKPEDETKASKIVEVKNGLLSKNTRARNNYNEEIVQLAESLPKVRKCWRFHKEEEKEKIGKNLEIFQGTEILQDFKKCVLLMQRVSLVEDQKINIAISHYNKVLKEKEMIKKLNELVDKNKEIYQEEYKVCKEFEEGKYKKFLK